MESLLEGLNQEQREAVQHTEGPLLILAGAGSGKTKVLTVRVAYLLAQGVSPFEILVITFTNKAAKEMKERVANIVGPVAEKIWLSTFHSFCAKLLRFEINGYLGYNSNFTIYDTSDSQVVIKAALKALNLDDKYYPVMPCYRLFLGLKIDSSLQPTSVKRHKISTIRRWPMSMNTMSENCGKTTQWILMTSF